MLYIVRKVLASLVEFSKVDDVASCVTQQFFMVTLFYYQFMIKKWVIMKFSIDLPCSPPVGQHQSSQNLFSEITSYEFYNDFGTLFFINFDEKTCTEVVEVLRICSVWVLWSTVLMQLYRSPTWQTH